MARDEALLQAHAAGSTPPTIRLYRWLPACLSLGRFQRSDAVRWDACAAANVAVVRRPSGGRALLHADELTYAVIARVDHLVFANAETIPASYQRINTALLAGLRHLGVAAELAPRRSRTSEHNASSVVKHQAPSVNRPSPACFDTPAAYELTVAGRKLAGSAQARREGVLLQHGALPFTPHAAQLQTLLDCGSANLDQTMITLDAARGQPVNFDEVAAALVAGFEHAWNMTLESGARTAEEQALEDDLRATRYATDAWTRMR